MTQYAILTDLNKCVGCLACSVSCKVINNVPVGNYWNKVLRVGPNPRKKDGQWPDVYTYLHIALSGNFYRDKDVFKLFDSFEKISDVRFSIKGKTVYIRLN